MKILAPLLWLALLANCISPQKDVASPSILPEGEFPIYENGLIYDPSTMSLLADVVDSLSLRFKSWAPKTFYSLEQGYATYFSIDKKNAAKARAVITRSISLDDFKKQFLRSEIIDSLWIVKSYDTRERQPVLRYESMDLEYKYVRVPHSLQFNRTSGWIYEEHSEGIEILYLHDLRSTPIPAEYGRLIQYVDCMIDTTATIYPTATLDFDVREFFKNSRMSVFLDLAKDFEPEPERPTFTSNSSENSILREKFDSTHNDWNTRRMSALDEKMKKPKNARLFNEALQEATDHQLGWALAEYAERYLPAPKLLDFKRSYYVPTICNFDSGQWDHAMAICLLAAKCHQWDIFLRAHMDILVDNVGRNINEIHGLTRRVTYIKEIEELNINSIDLLVGSMLAAKNLNQNHYQTYSVRVADAMSGSKQKPAFENLILKMINDERLDIYNRMQMTEEFLFLCRESGDGSTRCNLEKIKDSVKKLPDGIEDYFPNWWNP